MTGDLSSIGSADTKLKIVQFFDNKHCVTN